METMEDSISWSWWRLADAEPLALFTYLRLRSDVFVVEQGCAYPDMDNHNLVAWHLTGTDASGRLLAVARLLPPGEKYKEPSLGRVIVTPAARGTGRATCSSTRHCGKLLRSIRVTATASRLRRTWNVSTLRTASSRRARPTSKTASPTST